MPVPAVLVQATPTVVLWLKPISDVSALLATPEQTVKQVSGLAYICIPKVQKPQHKEDEDEEEEEEEEEQQQNQQQQDD